MSYILDKKIIYFLHVVEEGSFSAAARKLYLSQPAISQYMEDLEEKSGIILFDRKSYRAIPTEEGRKLYEACKKIYEESKNLEKQLLQNNFLRIGFTRSYSNRHILEFINLLKRKYPNVHFDLIEGSFGENTEKLLKDQVDIAFGLKSEFQDKQKIEFIPLYTFKLCVICSYDNPISSRKFVCPIDLKNQEFILLSKKFSKNNYYEMLDAFRNDGINPRIIKEVDSLDELIYSIATSQGIGIVSGDVVSEEDVCIIQLNNSCHQSVFSIGYKKKHTLLIDNIIEEAKKFYKTP